MDLGVRVRAAWIERVEGGDDVAGHGGEGCLVVAVLAKQ